MNFNCDKHLTTYQMRRGDMCLCLFVFEMLNDKTCQMFERLRCALMI